MLTSQSPSPSPPSSPPSLSPSPPPPPPPTSSARTSAARLFRRQPNPAQKSAPSSYHQHFSPPPPPTAITSGHGVGSSGAGSSAGLPSKSSNKPNRHSTTSVPSSASRENRHKHSHSHSHSHSQSQSHSRTHRSKSSSSTSAPHPPHPPSEATTTKKAVKRRLSMQSHFNHIAPEITTHLTDRDSNPILSTHPSPSSPALLSLSSAFVQAYETAAHLGLGVPQRVTLSATGGNVLVIQTAANSQLEEEKLAAAAAAAAAAAGVPSAVVGGDIGAGFTANAGNAQQGAGIVPQQGAMGVAAAGNVAGATVDPEASASSNGMLVGTIVAPVGQTAEAMVASWGIEDVAKRLQDGISNK